MIEIADFVVSLNIDAFNLRSTIRIPNKPIEQILDEAFGCYLYVCHYLIQRDYGFGMSESKLGYAMLLESFVQKSSYTMETNYYYWAKRFRTHKVQIEYTIDVLRKSGFIKREFYKIDSNKPLNMLLEKYIKESKELYNEGEKKDLLGFRYSKALPVEQGQDD